MESKGRVIAVCISEKKGTQKTVVPSIDLVPEWGIKGDAHAGNWHRQVSLLALEKIEAFRERGADVEFGAFGENIIVEGFDLRNLPVGTRFRIGDALLELTQIGKECHDHCAIYHQVGDCIMPREGVFTIVLEGGTVKAGDEIEMIEAAPDRAFTAAWITLSDKGAAGEREDKSGPLIGEILTEAGYNVVEGVLIPDEPAELKRQLMRLADQRQVNVIFTTGGTGFSKRDRTPEATKDVCDRMTPGIAEAIRAYSMTKTPTAMLSRATAGMRNETLIINLPGSPKAVRECLEFLLHPLEHGLEIMLGRTGECARN
ncbi:MAG: MOSC domain-containing protein [Mogibacterium sp.]|nr:MOSC domain-containing protein [Mogibacterium sp.]MBQ6501101.1 MOSC domain-containing protein [Mogibacterium sp.]